MNSDKKNQHYIPKFYLRNFSFQGNNNQIGVYNIVNEKFIERAKLKTQGSKNFFYGSDGVIEESLADIEGRLSQTLKVLIGTAKLPQKGSQDHFDLMAFIALTDMRNPVRINGIKNMVIEMTNRLKEIDPSIQTEKFFPELNHEEAIGLSLGNTLEIAKIITDLEYKLFINSTNKPFITSDYPAVKYNQFLEAKKWPGSKTGYGVTGLQIFFPLNSKIAIFLYDSGIYKVGYRKQSTYEVTNPSDIDKINVLQFINCFDTIFFDENASERYIKSLHQESRKFKRANKSRAELSYIAENNKDYEQLKKSGQKNLLVMNTTDCETRLSIEGIKIHSKGKTHKLNPTMDQSRPHVETMRKYSR